LQWAAGEIERLYKEKKNAVPVRWLTYNMHVLTHVGEMESGMFGWLVELWIELGNQGLKSRVTGRCKRFVELFLTTELLTARALRHLSRRPDIEATQLPLLLARAAAAADTILDSPPPPVNATA
jgi:hypothetical protein